MSQSGVVAWSTTASSNATADSAAPWPEGMAPSQVNDSARGGMASVAKYRDDTAGSLVTSGSSTAYTVTSNQNVSTTDYIDGQRFSLKFHTASGAAPTLSIDGLAAWPLQTIVGTAVPTGFFIANSIWDVTADKANAAFIVHSAAGQLPASTVLPASVVTTASIADKAVTLRKMYHPASTARVLGSDRVAAQSITGAANNGSGLVRLTVSDTTGYSTGQIKTVSDVLGTTEANGTWTITVVDGTHVDLQSSTFANVYVSGGTIGGGVEELSLSEVLDFVGSAARGDILVRGASTWARVPVGTLGQVLTANGTDTFFGNIPLLHVREELSQNNKSGVANTSNVWKTRPITTTVTNEVGATLSSNQITLLAGTYEIDALVISGTFGVNNNAHYRCRLQNISDGATLVLGLNSFINAAASGGTSQNSGLTVPLRGRFTLSASKVVEIQAYTNASSDTTPSNISGVDEIWLDAMFRKVA